MSRGAINFSTWQRKHFFLSEDKRYQVRNDGYTRLFSEEIAGQARNDEEEEEKEDEEEGADSHLSGGVYCDGG